MANEIIIEVVDPAADADGLDRSAHELRQELLEIPEVEAVTTRTEGPPPTGAKGVDVASIGEMIVVAQSGVTLVGSLIALLQGWLKRREPTQSLKLTVDGKSIELTATAGQQQALVEEFLRQVAPAG
jgi:hypothetical protein